MKRLAKEATIAGLPRDTLREVMNACAVSRKITMRRARTAVPETAGTNKQLLAVIDDATAVRGASNREAAGKDAQLMLRDCGGTMYCRGEGATKEDGEQSPVVVVVRQFTADGHDACSRCRNCRDGGDGGSSVGVCREDGGVVYCGGRGSGTRGRGGNLGEGAVAGGLGDDTGSLVEDSGFVSGRRVFLANGDARNFGEIGGSGATCAGSIMGNGEDVRDYCNRDCEGIGESGAFCADSTLGGGGNVRDHDEGVGGIGGSGVVFAGSTIEGGMDTHHRRHCGGSRARSGEDGEQRGTSPLDTFVVEFESAIRGVNGLDSSSRRRLVEVVRAV